MEDKRDQNGYAPSIMATEEGVCYVCGHRFLQTVRHEIYGGANRETSKRCGFWVDLCPTCHARVHSDYDLMRTLRRRCEHKYQATHSRNDFYRLIGHYYDRDDDHDGD